MAHQGQSVRVGADIGGTFTDVAVAVGPRIHSTKVLTDYTAPERAIIAGLEQAAQLAEIPLTAVDALIHGATLATNALIERRGAKTALVTTEGFRDVIEMRTESRFEQYDLNIRLPEPLIAREDRLTLSGRLAADGTELAPLDIAEIDRLADLIAERGYEAIAVGLLHAYANPAHEIAVRDRLAARLPQASISISSEVSPQMREYERFNTVAANAYVRPLMASYLRRMTESLRAVGVACPVHMIHSGGGLISLETAIDFPVRLVESGPAGGAIFAADLARRFGVDKALSYDMGGTTAKICLIEDAEPKTARVFEAARSYRFKKGSGMPISIPVIEMVEIGAGGGSIASVDAMGRIAIGPESAGSTPGPACYALGGARPTVTDADLLLGKIDPDNFAGGAIRLDRGAAEAAMARDVGAALGLDPIAASYGAMDMVDENMANAARVHAVESGKPVSDFTMIAFGGAAPLHAARLAEKLGVERFLVPPGAGVGSAIGFLRAPFAYEAVRTDVTPLSRFDPEVVNATLDALTASVTAFVEGAGADAGAIAYERVAFMRYAGQGWEIPVSAPAARYEAADASGFADRFRAAYARHFGRAIDAGQASGSGSGSGSGSAGGALEGLEIEIVSWSIKAAAPTPPPEPLTQTAPARDATAAGARQIFDPAAHGFVEASVYERSALAPGDHVRGPAVIVERETATVLTSRFDATLQDDGTILAVRKAATTERANV